jgi:hypothetical protein
MENFEQTNPAELRKNVSETQSEMYGSALVRLMERSNDNLELVNALRDFIKEVDIKSWRGKSDEPMPENYTKNLAEFFKQKTEELKQII